MNWCGITLLIGIYSDLKNGGTRLKKTWTDKGKADAREKRKMNIYEWIFYIAIDGVMQ